MEDIVELLKIILTDMELPVMQETAWKDLKPALVEAAEQESFRHNYRNAMVKEVNGQIAGFFFGYKGESASDGYDLPTFET